MTNASLPTITTATAAPKDVDALVIGVAEASGGPVLVGAGDELEKAWAKRHAGSLLSAAQQVGASTKVGATVTLPGSPLVVVTGLGGVDVTPEQVRRAAGSGVRAAAATGSSQRVAVSFDAVEPDVIRGVAEGALLGSYAYVKAGASVPAPTIGSLVIVSPTRDAALQVERAAVVARAVVRARDWVNTPANVLYPETFAEAARGYVRDAKIAVEILDEKALEKGGYGGIMAVGGGSARGPRLVRLSYAPRGAKTHLALVGKGITFDSGGLDIKPAGQMAGMKFDMSGAAAVIAATRAIADLGLNVRVTAYAALAENMPSGSSYRSSDVLTMFDGQRVENFNTDAEGRLVMADAIGRAGTEGPDLIVDVATLTGACMVALGMRTGGLITNGEETSDLLLDAAETAGEDFWELPLTEYTRNQLKTQVADFRSGANHRWGGALVAGAFLERFVPEGVAWAHLDIAGPAENPEEPYGCVPKGGTGVAVRTLVALAAQLA